MDPTVKASMEMLMITLVGILLSSLPARRVKKKKKRIREEGVTLVVGILHYYFSVSLAFFFLIFPFG